MSSWSDLHKTSEQTAIAAEIALRAGDNSQARLLYSKAAELEEKALATIDPRKHRTRGITAVSAVALFYKAEAYGRAANLAEALLADSKIPQFARDDLRSLLSAISEKMRSLEVESSKSIEDSGREAVEYAIEFSKSMKNSETQGAAAARHTYNFEHPDNTVTFSFNPQTRELRRDATKPSELSLKQANLLQLLLSTSPEYLSLREITENAGPSSEAVIQALRTILDPVLIVRNARGYRIKAVNITRIRRGAA